MNLFWAAFLGIVQGATEFLPVSSSGHLVLVQALIPGFSQPGVLFEVVLHAGTLFAILYYFKDSLLKINSKYILLLIIGTVPAGIVGLLFSDFIEGFFENVQLVGLALILTGIMDFLTDRLKTKRKTITRLESLLVGTAQAMAIIPGISRSGSTIFAGTGLGIKREEAAKFSFLLSVPAVIGANLQQFLAHGIDGVNNANYYAIGFFAAFLSGLIAIRLVMKLLLSYRFRVFAFYCFAIGVLTLIF